ncbi:MAG: hypothetical protein HYX63_10295 [Gammaproteobacteria bacterium]|nr:hypothetical protein [Gammaproteobacteria bacterium]
MHASFLSYRNFFYLKIALGLTGVAVLAYALHNPTEPPNGGTWLGYTLGTVGAALIGWLAWFGVRKRRYHDTQNRLAAWLSAHVYLGTTLVIITTLHSGFQLGWNVHSIAYVLTLLVVASGFYGLYAYVTYPRLLTANRGGVTRDALIAEVAELDRECLMLSDQVGKDAHQVVLHSIEETVLGGSVWDQLFGDPARRAAAASVSEGLDVVKQRIEARIARGAPEVRQVAEQDATAISFLAGHMLVEGAGPERLEKIRRLFDLISRKRALVERIQRDIQYQSRLAFWLYLHVPLSVGLLAALFAHIFSVFFYW